MVLAEGAVIDGGLPGTEPRQECRDGDAPPQLFKSDPERTSVLLLRAICRASPGALPALKHRRSERCFALQFLDVFFFAGGSGSSNILMVGIRSNLTFLGNRTDLWNICQVPHSRYPLPSFERSSE